MGAVLRPAGTGRSISCSAFRSLKGKEEQKAEGFITYCAGAISFVIQ